jgi:hypothetical protein
MRALSIPTEAGATAPVRTSIDVSHQGSGNPNRMPLIANWTITNFGLDDHIFQIGRYKYIIL